MTGAEKLQVLIFLGDIEVEVGELVRAGRSVYFRYTSDFIERGIEISPFKLPLSDKIQTTNFYPFDGLFGVFNDSLPDGWGRLLLDRTLTLNGILPDDVNPLDRLAFIGKNGMGALTYQTEIKLQFNAENNLELDVIANQMNQVLKGESREVIEELYELGGSSGGARPKILVGYNPEKETLIHGTNEIPNDYEHWIIKFPSSTDSPDIANIEFTYYKMALDAGIKMNPCKLFTGKSGKQYFGTKRFDRIKNRRLHIHSASGLLHDNFRQSTMDYGHLMDCAFKLEKNVEAYNKILKLAAFNVFAHNRDDHSKNFSFLMDETGKWELAPAYDLTFSASGFGMHSTTIAREGKSPGKKHLIELAKHFGIKKADETIQQTQQVVSEWNKYANNCGVSEFSKKQIDRIINGFKT